MQHFKTKINNLPKGIKVLVRILYPVLLYTLLYFLFVRAYNMNERTIQVIFILIWGALEWYFFLSKKK